MITDWNAVPLVCSITITAAVLGRSVRAIERDLANDCMLPAPMPAVARRTKHRRQWSKAALMAWLDGGYLQFVQQAHRESRKGTTRHFFGKPQSMASRDTAAYTQRASS